MEVIQIFKRNDEPELLRITSHAPLPVGLETQINGYDAWFWLVQ